MYRLQRPQKMTSVTKPAVSLREVFLRARVGTNGMGPAFTLD
jgi:hypothetical protein